MISVSPEEGDLISWRQELYSDSQEAVRITFWDAVFIDSIFYSGFYVILFDIGWYWIGVDAEGLCWDFAEGNEFFDKRVFDFLKQGIIGISEEGRK